MIDQIIIPSTHFPIYIMGFFLLIAGLVYALLSMRKLEEDATRWKKLYKKECEVHGVTHAKMLEVQYELENVDHTSRDWLSDELVKARHSSEKRRKRIERALKRAKTKSPNSTVKAMCAILRGDMDNKPYNTVLKAASADKNTPLPHVQV